MRIGQNVPGGYLRSVLPEHTDVKYRTFSPGRPARMRTGHFPGRITALDHTGHLAPGDETEILHSSEPDTLSRASLARAYRTLPQAALTASVTHQYTAPCGTTRDTAPVHARRPVLGVDGIPSTSITARVT